MIRGALYSFPFVVVLPIVFGWLGLASQYRGSSGFPFVWQWHFKAKIRKPVLDSEFKAKKNFVFIKIIVKAMHSKSSVNFHVCFSVFL